MKLSLSNSEIQKVTGLQGYRLYFHQKRKKTILDLVTTIAPTGGTILDFGCGNGDISVELALLGYNVQGIDIEASRICRAKEIAAKHDANAVFENKPYTELLNHGKYNVILMGEVLEHFEAPHKLLRDIKILLNAQGNVVITAPNMPSLRNRLKFGLFGVFPDNNPDHKYYFDFRRFSDVITEAEYKVIYLYSRFTFLFHSSSTISLLENIVLFWFSRVFKKSGDTLLAVITPK